MKLKKEEVLGGKAGYDDDEIQPFNVTYIPEKVGSWLVEIDNGISCPAQFQYAIRALEMADEDNPVVIKLQCPGGSLGATDALIHAMRKCKGHIHIVATGGCHSSATLILLEADSFELSEGFHALLHCGSLGNIGNLNEYTRQAEFDAKFMPRIIRSAYEGFLSEDEIDKLLDGKDIWLDAEAWVERATKRKDYFDNKAAEFLEKQQKKQRKPRVKKSPTAVEQPE